MISTQNFLKLTFFLSLTGTLGSLFFSNVLGFDPCLLCWYQRICLFPIVVVSGVAIWFDDPRPIRYIAPFVLLGLAIASYHNLIYYHVISEGLTPCTQGLSCSAKQLDLFGFITIPLLSMLAFLVLAILIALTLKRSNHAEK